MKKKPITGRYQYICRTTTRVHVLQTNRPLFSFDTNDVTRNLDGRRNRQLVSMWRTTYEDGHLMRDSTRVRTKNYPSSSLRICTDQWPKLQETERTATKTNVIVKSEENTSFCDSSFFLLYFISFTKYKPFCFKQIVFLFLFSRHVSCYSKPYFSLHCRYWFRLILNG